MANLDKLLIFVEVAQFETITRAARSLGMPISSVSRRLSVLESELGRVAPEANHAAGDLDCAGARVLQPMPGAAESPARS